MKRTIPDFLVNIFFLSVSLLLIYMPSCLYSQQENNTDPDPLRYENQINTFIEWDKKNSFPTKAILFAGSSSIRFWSTSVDFPNLPVINRGFGGAQISDMLYYFDITVKPYYPSLIVFYCGDNDIDFGKTAGRVYNDFLKFVSKIHDYLPGTHLVYLAIKPSYSRLEFWPEMQKANHLIEEFCDKNDDLHYIDTATPLMSPDQKPKQFLFLSDSLHLNIKGYQIWKSVVDEPIRELYRMVKK